jgi:hypothetical protein
MFLAICCDACWLGGALGVGTSAVATRTWAEEAEAAEDPARADGVAITAIKPATARAEPAITATSFPDFGMEEMVEDNVSLS